MNWSCNGTVWTKIIERVFYEEFDFENNNEHFENINLFTHLINLLGVIAIRIFFNIGKMYLFTVRFKRKENLYSFFMTESKKIFLILCDNVNARSVNEQIKLFKPFIDYDASFLKITNTYYYYLKEKNAYESLALKELLKKDYSNIDFDFYLSRRSKFAHMRLNLPLISIADNSELIRFIREFWQENNEPFLFSLFKYNIVIFKLASCY